MNNFLKNLEVQYTNSILEHQTDNLKIDTKELKRLVTKSESISFFVVAEELIERYALEGKIGTRDKAKSICCKIRKFHQSEKLLLEEVNVRFITEYQTFALKYFGNKKNTINKDLKFIKRVINYAIQQDIMKEAINPFKKITLHSEPTHRDFLTLHEIGLLELVPVKGLEKRCLQTCLFQYYSGGLRISDVLLLRKGDVENGRLKINIKKTNKQLNHVLNSRAQAILNEFIQDKSADALVFDYLSHGKGLSDSAEAIDSYISSTTALINKYIKKLCRSMGFQKNVSTHVFRHSFAMHALEKGISMESLQEILKHSNIRETQNYGKMQSKAIDAALQQFSTN